MIKHSEAFKQEAMRIALTSGLPRGRVPSDLGGAAQADLARAKGREVCLCTRLAGGIVGQ